MKQTQIFKETFYLQLKRERGSYSITTHKMPREKVLPDILERAMNLLKSSFFMAKIRKPIRLKLVIMRKSINFKKLIRHRNSDYTPLFHYQSSSRLKTLGSRTNLSCSMFFHCYRHRRRLSTGLRIEDGGQDKETEEDYLNRQMDVNHDKDVVVRQVLIDDGKFLDSGGEDECDVNIDRKAEMFIQRFYREMRLERQDSNIKLIGYTNHIEDAIV